LFQEIGGPHGFSPVTAGFRPFKEFKVQWQRCGQAATFQVTDYLRWAEREMLVDFADCMFQRITSKKRMELYSPMLKDWLRSKDFVDEAQPLYLRRSKNLSYRSEGATYDLRESFQRLVRQGLVKDHEGVYLSWTRKPNHQRVGYCSALMRVIAISSVMDSPFVPEFVTDYVLYHELLHMEDGLNFSGRYHGPAFRRRERQFPRWEEAEMKLKGLAKDKGRRAA
jgi:predicted metal-dependent hydrolase